MRDIHYLMEILLKYCTALTYTADNGYVTITEEEPIKTTKKFSEMQLFSIYAASNSQCDFVASFIRKWEEQPSEVMNNDTKM